MTVQWIAHRGIRGSFAENTREAFDSAVDRGFTTLETDLRVTRDKRIVLVHDATIERVAGISGRVASLDSDYLSSIELKAGGQLLFFDEFVDRYREQQWVFDIKKETGSEVVSILERWGKAGGNLDLLQNQARFLFWDTAHEHRLRQILPNARIFASQRECWRAGIAVLLGLGRVAEIATERSYAVPYRLGPWNLFQPRIVETYHRQGGLVIAYLPETRDQAQQAVDVGFDYILSDHDFI